jgi:2-hydroxy-3-keto-5-methylthiopentenyl-1-phosphate phosphatase
LRVTPLELDSAICSIEIDPSFPAFLNFCRNHRMDVAIVSDGFDRVVRSVLERARLSVPFFANRLAWQGSDRWRLEFPFARSDCRSGGANCKCSHRPFGHGRSVVVGDGRSDFCMAVHADFVICKRALAVYCQDNRLPHASFSTFNDVIEHLGAWIDASRGVLKRTSAPKRKDSQRERFAQRRANG